MESLAMRDVYPIALAKLSPREIVAWCSINRSNRSRCTADFWRSLIRARWGNIIGQLEPHLEYQERYKEDARLFFDAVKNNDLILVKDLLRRGIDVNLQEKRYGYTALNTASNNGYYEMVQELIKAGADVNFGYGSSLTALEAAKIGNHTEVIQELILAGAL